MDILLIITFVALFTVLVSANAGADDDDDSKMGCVAGAIFLLCGSGAIFVWFLQFIHNLFS